jgi:hypothetical protein
VTGAEFRARARLVLGGMLVLDADEVRRAHNLACLLGDEEAVALWARVIWKALAGDARYDWLRRPAGVRSKPTDWSVEPVDHPPPRPIRPPPMPPAKRYCTLCRKWGDHDGRSHGGRGKHAWRPTAKALVQA